MKYLANLSGGKDSAAMVLALMEKGYPLDEAVYYDNGMDFTAIHHVVHEQLKPRLEAYGAKLTVLHPKNDFLYDMFERKVKYRSKEGYHYGYSWCGGSCRWGTTEKTKTIDRYANGAYQYIGIAADEKARLDKNRGTGKRYSLVDWQWSEAEYLRYCRQNGIRRTEHSVSGAGKLYPLVDWQWSEADCLRYCRQNGIRWTEHSVNGDVDLYDVLSRVSCFCCANKNLNELRAMYWKLPEYWQKLREMQQRTDRPFKRGWSIFDLEKRFEKEKTQQAVTKSRMKG